MILGKEGKIYGGVFEHLNFQFVKSVNPLNFVRRTLNIHITDQFEVHNVTLSFFSVYLENVLLVDKMFVEGQASSPQVVSLGDDWGWGGGMFFVAEETKCSEPVEKGRNCLLLVKG